jgi:hypothetical protein
MKKLKGLYICKTYWAYQSAPRKIFPVLKYGKTNNIETRMYYYNKNATYKLLAFFPCDFIDIRESLVQREYDEYRLTKSEHMIYEKNFKSLYETVKDAASCKITKTKNKNGAIGHWIGDLITD